MHRGLAAVAALVAAVSLAACGGSGGSPARTLADGVRAIRTTPDFAQLDGKLGATIRALRREHPTSPAARRGRALALAGFTATRRGIETQLSMRTHDSGRLEAAVRDAKRADRYLNRGARLLRAAGHALDVKVGRVNGR